LVLHAADFFPPPDDGQGGGGLRATILRDGGGFSLQLCLGHLNLQERNREEKEH